MAKKIIIMTIGLMFCGAFAQGKSTKVASHPVNHEFKKVSKKSTVGKICKIKTKRFGIIRSKANSYEEAFSKGVETCFQKLNSNHMKTHKKYPGMDEQVSFANTCTNIECH